MRCLSRPFDLEEGRITINEYGEFVVFGGMETAWQHREFADYEKNFYTLSVMSYGLTDAKKITVQYKLDDDTTYTTLDDVFTESPYQVIYLPELSGKYLKLKFTLSSPSDTSMIAYIIGGKIRPDKRKEFDFTVKVAQKLSRPNGAILTCNVAEVMKKLREINDAKLPVSLYTFDGQEFTVTLENLKEVLLTDPIHKPREYLCSVNALEAKLN